MPSRIFRLAALLFLFALAIPAAFPQNSDQLKTFLSQKIGLTPDQIQSVQNGQPFAKNMPSRTPAEIFVFGVIYINAAPEAYVKWATDANRLRQIPGYLAFDYFSNPPQLSDLQDFGFDSDDIKSLQNCKPGDCVVQLPARTMNELRNSVNWSASNVDDQVNQFAQKLALSRLLEYQKVGDRILGAVYNDKSQQVNVTDQFKYMLSYSQVLPHDLPDFYSYLLNYPDNKPSNVENSFYWDEVKFGLKPTLRMVHVLTMQGDNPAQPAYVIAESSSTRATISKPLSISPSAFATPTTLASSSSKPWAPNKRASPASKVPSFAASPSATPSPTSKPPWAPSNPPSSRNNAPTPM